MNITTVQKPRRAWSTIIMRRVFPLLAGLMILAVVGLSFYELWVMNFGPDAAAYSYTVADPGNLPPSDARGAFLQLDAKVNTRYPSNLIGLTATTVPGVISTTQAIHVWPDELDAVIIRQSAIADAVDYRVYPLASDAYPMASEILPNGVMIRLFPKDHIWQPGNYIVDVPSNGTFGGRDYYAFVIDEKK